MFRVSAPVTACPRCQRALEERDAGGETILVCVACGGLWLECHDHGTWFDARELGRIVEAADAPGLLEVAVETGLARTKEWLSRAPWGNQKLPG